MNKMPKKLYFFQCIVVFELLYIIFSCRAHIERCSNYASTDTSSPDFLSNHIKNSRYCQAETIDHWNLEINLSIFFLVWVIICIAAALLKRWTISKRLSQVCSIIMMISAILIMSVLGEEWEAYFLFSSSMVLFYSGSIIARNEMEM